MNPKNIGIITFHHTLNYGATLQAYALMTCLREMGHTVELIDYRPQSAIDFYSAELMYYIKKPYRLAKPQNQLGMFC